MSQLEARSRLAIQVYERALAIFAQRAGQKEQSVPPASPTIAEAESLALPDTSIYAKLEAVFGLQADVGVKREFLRGELGGWFGS